MAAKTVKLSTDEQWDIIAALGLYIEFTHEYYDETYHVDTSNRMKALVKKLVKGLPDD